MAATLHPLPRFVSAEAAPPDPILNPARVRLAEAIAVLDRARAEVELAAEPVHRLTSVVDEHALLMAQLHELQDRDAGLTGRWIAGGRVGADPGDAVDTRALTDQIAAMQLELAAARRTLPDAEQQHRGAIERLGAAATARDAALDEVAVAVANDVAAEFTEALNQALTIEARLLSLHNALLERARTIRSAGAAAEQIAVMIRAAKRGAGVPRAPEVGRQLLDALASDPQARL